MIARGTAARLGLLASLYVSQGLPFGFFTQALPVLLRKHGLSLEQIGLSSLLAVPWALKFVWAPLVDRYSLKRIGRRRSWIIPMQILTVLLLLATALREPTASFRWVLVAVLGVNLLSATQDIATDGLAVDMLAVHERGLANGIQVAGYRAGMILGGGALLIFFERIGWTWTFVAMAGLVSIASLPVVMSRERDAPAADPLRVHPRTNFFRRPYALRVLTLLTVYKLGDAFAVGMLRPFLSDQGLSIGDIGWLVGTVGFVAGLLGALAGGGLITRIGRKRSLVGFAGIQAVTVLGYAYVAKGHPGNAVLCGLCAAEHFAGGMATAALFTCMMDWTEPDTAATDYTIQASVVVIATGVAASLSGFSAQRLGYGAHFLIASVFALSVPLLVRVLFPKPEGPSVPTAEAAPCV